MIKYLTVKELMINQHEANIVKYIFESYAKGHGYRKIANALNHKGYVTKKAKPFSISSITYIISNPFYIGKIQFAKYRHWSDKNEKDSMKNQSLQMVSMRLLLIKLYGIKYSLNAKRVARNHKFTVKGLTY